MADTIQGITIAARGGPSILAPRTRPALRPTYVIVKPAAVALNPADVMFVHRNPIQPGMLAGCDYAGTVLAVGSEVTRFKVGDRIAGCARAGNDDFPDDGTFAEEIVVKGDIALHIPPQMSWQDAATLGVTTITTGRAFYEKLEIPNPPAVVTAGTQVFVYGGSSAMGTMVIQFAKISGFEVLTTCSPRNFELVKSYGADHVFDYSDPASIDKVNSISKGNLKLFMDCISTQFSATWSTKVLAPGSIYSAIAGPVICPRDDVVSKLTVGYSFLNESWAIEPIGHRGRPVRADFDKAVAFAKITEKLLAEGRLRPHPVVLREGGLAVIPQGIEDLRLKKISGRKIVVPLE